MKTRNIMHVLTIAAVGVFSSSAVISDEQEALVDAANVGVVNVDVVNVGGKTGTLYIAVYDTDENFSAYKNPLVAEAVTIEKKQESVRVKLDLIDGEYAISAYLDENKNGRIDLAGNGMPIELYGHSGEPNMYGPPLFELAKVEMSHDKPVELSLR